MCELTFGERVWTVRFGLCRFLGWTAAGGALVADLNLNPLGAVPAGAVMLAG